MPHSFKVSRSMAAFVALALTFALLFSGCGNTVNSFTWRAATVPSNLDPQLVTASPDIIAVTHLFSGLFRKDDTGALQNECAESYTVSSDGLVYTFHLREGLQYQGYRGAETEYTVTAQDFVFAFQRVFSPATGSPWAESFSLIENAAEVLNGADPSELGVRALDPLTLEIRLTYASDNFCEKLCLPGAMPCNQAYFESTNGAYGLNKNAIVGNGSFYLYNWTTSGLFLRRAPSGKQVDSLRIVQATDTEKTAPQLVADEDCDAALYEGEAPEELAAIPYTTTTWALLFNCTDLLANANLRSALGVSALQSCEASGVLQAEGLIPPGMRVNGEYYRDAAGNVLPLDADAKALFATALAEEGLRSVSGLTALVPEGNDYSQLFGSINERWQTELSVFCNVRATPLNELQEAVTKGEFQIALVPLVATGSDPLTMLSQFDSGLCNYTDGGFHSALQSIDAMPDTADRLQALAAQERRLIEQGVAVPLYNQTDHLILNAHVNHLVFDPFGPVLDLTYATKG